MKTFETLKFTTQESSINDVKAIGEGVKDFVAIVF